MVIEYLLNIGVKKVKNIFYLVFFTFAKLLILFTLAQSIVYPVGQESDHILWPCSIAGHSGYSRQGTVVSRYGGQEKGSPSKSSVCYSLSLSLSVFSLSLSLFNFIVDTLFTVVVAYRGSGGSLSGLPTPFDSLLPDNANDRTPPRGHLALIFLAELAFEIKEWEFQMHLPVILHQVFLGFDTSVSEHCRVLLLNLVHSLVVERLESTGML